MQDIDRMIEEALDGEEQALFRETAREPGFFEQAFGLLGGPNGWVNVIMMVVQTALFVAGLWAGWRFFEADNALSALHWGLPAAVLVLASLIVKTAMMPEMQANRLMRELKRLQLQTAVGRKG
ncbi:MAG: hypothetical protein Q7U72_04890 [Brevundimonas sp.]|uniref:DUF6768 family protein n=1 Tax=Brevundimonas sp. TaxID=1871086 RepID=UPI00271B605D|nr:DUF6768 family protein [Brevundimonas sp.]MDO9076770.1 hypothetical protein [Brevundimonas sp.]MDP3081435.1 hypothetical protein [Brevundimonas sp.]MDZ4110941.1 DUF6768 family protein [Brevundimonas sp.]